MTPAMAFVRRGGDKSHLAGITLPAHHNSYLFTLSCTAFRTKDLCANRKMKCQLALCAPVIYAALTVLPAVVSATPYSLEVNHRTNYCARDLSLHSGGDGSIYLKQIKIFGAHRNPRLLMCWLPSLERLVLADSSKLLEPSSLTTTARMSPSPTPSTYFARRRLSSLLRYVSNLRKGRNVMRGPDENLKKWACILEFLCVFSLVVIHGWRLLYCDGLCLCDFFFLVYLLHHDPCFLD